MKRIFLILGLLVTGTLALAQTWSTNPRRVMTIGVEQTFAHKILAAVDVADLPTTCTAGDIFRLADGDMVGSVVKCGDGTLGASNTFYCLDYFTEHIMNPACPPWNMVSEFESATAAQQATNFTQFQAVLDHLETKIPVSPSPQDFSWKIKIPGREFVMTDTSNTNLSYNLTPTTCNFILEGNGLKTILRFNHNGTNGLVIQSAGGDCNNGRISNISFIGGDDQQPTTALVNCSSCYQFKFDHISCERFTAYCIKINGNHNTLTTGVIGGTPSLYTGSPSAAIYVSGNYNTITNFSAEPVSVDSSADGALVELEDTLGNIVAFNRAVSYGFGVVLTGTGRGNKIIGNSFVVYGQCIKITSDDATSTSGWLIDGNYCGGVQTSDPLATRGINVQDVYNVTITNNTIDRFESGMYFSDITGGLVSGNTFIRGGGDCIASVERITGVTVINNRYGNGNSDDGCDDNTYGPDGTAATSGGNYFEALIPLNSTAAAIVADTSDFAASDQFALATAPQTITGPDSGDANPCTSPTDEIWSSNIHLVNSDADGCDIAPSFSNLGKGQRLQVEVDSSAGGTVGFSNDSGTTCQDYTTATLGVYEYYNSALNYLRGASATGAC